MTDLEGAQRAAVAAEARSWCGTPYHHHAKVKWSGVDCGHILIAVYSAAGLIDDFDPGPYPADWHLHRDEERYLGFVERLATEFDWRAQPIRGGDLVVWKWGRTFSHGAIVTGDPKSAELTGWPWVVHAFAPARFVVETDVTGSPMDGNPMRAFTLWPNGAPR